jgi:hypothetical protein
MPKQKTLTTDLLSTKELNTNKYEYRIEHYPPSTSPQDLQQLLNAYGSKGFNIAHWFGSTIVFTRPTTINK